VIPNLDGAAHFRVEDQAGQPREVRLMSYLDGTPLDSTHSSPEQRERIGEMLARLRHASAGFRHPAESRVLAWDVKHLASLGNLIDGVDDPAQKRQLAAGMERFLDIAPRVAALRSQVVHNDFSQSNIVVDHGSADFVVGIIDFGDAVHTAIAIDVSTALLNQLPRDAAQNPVDDLFWRGRDVLRGYLRHAELTREELMLIPHLAMARAVTRGLLSLWRARMFPENKTYLLRNTEQGWAQLKWFLERSPETVSRTLLTD
jgi:Ser/Thr protein kinase RdoA (MazF antagonist)